MQALVSKQLVTINRLAAQKNVVKSALKCVRKINAQIKIAAKTAKEKVARDQNAKMMRTQKLVAKKTTVKPNQTKSKTKNPADAGFFYLRFTLPLTIKAFGNSICIFFNDSKASSLLLKSPTNTTKLGC